MPRKSATSSIVHAGDLLGLGSIYDPSGRLLYSVGEKALGMAGGWDMQVKLGWRRILPTLLFDGFNGPVASTLYVTTNRIVLIREIDAWRETKGEMSILGIPGGVSKAAELKRLARLGAREFCEIFPKNVHVARLERLKKLRSWLDFYLVGNDGLKYEVLMWKAEGEDEETTSLLESQFPKRPSS